MAINFYIIYFQIQKKNISEVKMYLITDVALDLLETRRSDDSLSSLVISSRNRSWFESIRLISEQIFATNDWSTTRRLFMVTIVKKRSSWIFESWLIHSDFELFKLKRCSISWTNLRRTSVGVLLLFDSNLFGYKNQDFHFFFSQLKMF